MVHRNHSAGLVFFIFHLKRHQVANIDIDGRGGVVRNSSPDLYHVNLGLPEKTGWLRACKLFPVYSNRYALCAEVKLEVLQDNQLFSNNYNHGFKKSMLNVYFNSII